MAPNWTTLVSTQALQQALGSDGLVVLDCRFELTRPDAGRAAWEAGHIPGASYADLNRDLSGPVSPLAGGRHPLPDPADLSRRLGDWGVTAGSQVVAYDAVGGMFASRLWWLLRWLGHERVAVLDGGYPAWVGEGGPVDQNVPSPRRSQFSGRPGVMPVLGAGAVAAGLADHSLLLIDSRAKARFLGRQEPLDKVAGHIPGAINLPQAEHLDADGRFRPAEELAAQFGAVLSDHPPSQAACMCGSGVTACHSLLAMAHAGITGAALYAGSWSDWISDARRPVATEDD